MHKKILILILMFLVAYQARATELYFSPEKNQEDTNQPFILPVLINVSQSINAIEGEIYFDSSALTLLRVDNSESLIPFWIDYPHVSNLNTVIFSGIVPGGIGGDSLKKYLLFNLVFHVNHASNSEFIFKNTHVFLNRVGSPEDEVSTLNTRIELKPTNEKTTDNSLILDFYPPEEFNISILKNSSAFNGKAVVIFLTQDKGAGIDHYEIRERFLWFWGDWMKGDSPYVLLHQSIFSIIEVKAVDKIGRQRIERIIPTNLIFLSAGVLLILMIEILSLIIFIRRNYRNWKHIDR